MFSLSIGACSHRKRIGAFTLPIHKKLRENIYINKTRVISVCSKYLSGSGPYQKGRSVSLSAPAGEPPASAATIVPLVDNTFPFPNHIVSEPLSRSSLD
jgi:hypothetical protein